MTDAETSRVDLWAPDCYDYYLICSMGYLGKSNRYPSYGAFHLMNVNKIGIDTKCPKAVV